MTNIDLTKQYWKYADDVINDRIVTGKYIKLACQRMIDWAKRDDIFFDYSDIDRKIRFVQKLKHSEGKHAGENFVLLPYQQWMYSNIFGWKYTGTNKRVVKNALLLLSRKAGKTFFGASLAMTVALCDGQKSPEIDFIANSSQQAEIAFRHCSQQAKSIDPKEKIIKRFRRNLYSPITGARINVLASDTSKLDGLGASFFLQDEGHEAKSFEVWNILKTSQGAIENPLAVGISTCGFHIGETYPLYNQWSYGTRILNNIIEDDSWFFALYQLDEEDDWKDEKNWIKANPSLGQTVGYDYMRDQIRSAINTPSNEVSIRTKNLNQWMQSSDVWIPRDYIQKNMQEVNLEEYRDEIAFGGCDLSVVCDLTAHSVCIPPNPDRPVNPDKFIFKTWLYIPEEAIENSSNKEYYKEWIRRGWAIKTAGNVVDYEHILKDQLEASRIISFVDYGYDQYNASSWAITAEQSGLPLCIYGQSIGHFNGPTKFFEMLVRSGKCIIDTNPAVDWCFGNVELMIDHNENTKPAKANGDKNAKIDPVISMLEALGCYLNSRYYAPEAWVIR